MKDRRKHKRLAIKIPAIWREEGSKKENISDAFLFNITRDGLFLKTHFKPPKGTAIELTLNLNGSSGPPEPIILKGKIIWIAKKSKHPYFYPGIGVKFEHIPKKDYAVLNAFIKNKLANFRDAKKLKNMYLKLKNMASKLVEIEEKHAAATAFNKLIKNAIIEIDEVAHILDREIQEIKKM